jgi:hypothetical protein
MTTTFTRVSDSGSMAGEASHITLNGLGFFSLTAVRASDGDLKLIGWRTGDTVSRLVDSGNQAGDVSEIAMTRNLNRTVTAVRTAERTLKLISWNDGTTLNSITRLADSGNQAGAASLITIKPVGSFSSADLVTAYRTGANTLKLISWGLQSGNGALTRLGDSSDQAGEVVGLIALTQIPNGNGYVTAVQDSIGNLKLITWGISPDGSTITRLADSGGQQLEAVSEIAMAGSVTAVRDSGDNLKLITWGISPDGSTITRLADSGIQAAATRLAISQFNSSRYVTAFRTTGSGRLQLIAFDVSPSGAVTRTGASDNLAAGTVGEVALIATNTDGVVTAVRESGNNLKVIKWIMEN